MPVRMSPTLLTVPGNLLAALAFAFCTDSDTVWRSEFTGCTPQL